ncbi:hypothetical protein IWX92DRAFT_383952 [Phyllosticta citricarpa]
MTNKTRQEGRRGRRPTARSANTAVPPNKLGRRSRESGTSASALCAGRCWLLADEMKRRGSAFLAVACMCFGIRGRTDRCSAATTVLLQSNTCRLAGWPVFIIPRPTPLDRLEAKQATGDQDRPAGRPSAESLRVVGVR